MLDPLACTCLLAQAKPNDVGNIQNVHPLAVAALGAVSVAVIAGRPRVSVLGLLAVAMWLPSAQRVLIGGADFSLVRIVVLVGMIRLLAAGSFSGLRFCAVDACVVAGVLARGACTFLTGGGGASLAGSVGASLDTAGAYFLVRGALRSSEDVLWLARASLFVAVPIVILFLVERATGRNAISVFGGVPLMTAIRENRLRCQGAFSHPILAGCFFVALLPLWFALFRTGRSGKVLAASGLAVVLLVIFSCASSTPVVALVGVGGAMFAYLFWRKLRAVLLVALALGFVMHFYMQHGIWHLISRIDLVGGSTGYHRYLLIDRAILHIHEWWLSGTTSTTHWGRGLKDITNQYILEGIRGGIWATLALFLSVVFSLAGIGRALRHWPARSPEHWMAYCAGAAIFAQAFIFLAVSYFGQTVIIWPVSLAIAVLWGELASDPRAAVRTAPRGPSRPSRPRLDPARRNVKPLPTLGALGTSSERIG